MEERLNKEMKLRSKEYRKFLWKTIDEYNSNGKKTILICCDAYFPVVDGVVNVMDNYAKELSKNMNVMVLIPDYRGKVYMRGYPTIGVESGYSKRLHYQIPLPMINFDYMRYLRKLRIDVIHSHSPFTIGHVALKMHRKRNIPLISTLHSQYKRDFEKQAKMFVPALMRYIMKCYNGSDEVWTMHTASKETLVSYGYSGDVRLMPNGTSIAPPINYFDERNKLRKEYLSNENELLFIFVGRLVTQKNILFIVDVLAELKKKGVKFRMFFVGEGPDKDKLTHKIEQYNLTNEISFFGQLDRDELIKIYTAADMFLFPSMYDVSSLVQIEAASRYTPTVFAEGSVTSCTVTHGVNGYVFPCDVKMYANGVYDAICDREQLNQISDNAYRDLYITWDKLIARAYERYVEIIDNKKQSN